MAFTYFWRDLHTLSLITRQLIPLVKGRRNITIWDAGCANGSEPYSLILLLAEEMSQDTFQSMSVLATDYDRSFESIVNDGVYSHEELERVPRDIFHRCFEPATQPDHYRICDRIKSRLTFIHHDLLSLSPVANEVSLILCKNVLLHFHAEQRAKVIRMFHSALTNGGMFATEQTQKLPPGLDSIFQRVSSDAQLYRKI